MAAATERKSLAVQEPKGWRRALLVVEKAIKESLFDCRMCGQCILHSTGMTCPMRCPKNLRNGPCGGVLVDGNCEVFKDKPCVWVQAWQRSRKLPLWRDHMKRLNPPVDWRLKETSSWENLVSGRDQQVPEGWRAAAQERSKPS
ncbi:MAG: methylenetetrahydrofolate reductase C-terminal domain-containing protein [Acidobacteria bacterium]|nr:methylenetetrahydrofolate reductase C-terminal domain-containing protein [Acidobacteriota bacterium]